MSGAQADQPGGTGPAGRRAPPDLAPLDLGGGQQPAEGGAGHTDDELVAIASAAGLPDESFGQCLRDQRYADWVKHVTAGMAQRGVRGTSTVFVGGVVVPDPSPENLAAAIDAASS